MLAAICAAAHVWMSSPVAGQEQLPLKLLEKDFKSTVQPLLKQYCHECHAGDRTEADIDLAAFATMADIQRQVKVWQKVREMLDTEQMPPKEAEQPDDAERTRLQKWVRDYLTAEARSSAGDPGRIVLRRLSNDEYTYTIRDLTGVDTLDPAREFPIDGAAGEGFTNTGSALVMSPSLVQKYLDAGKVIAEHAVLLPQGLRFSPYSTRRDQTDEILAQIQEFYRAFTDDGGGSSVNLQGIRFDTNQGGRLPLQKYLEATLADRDALTRGAKSVDAVARERGLNAKYLGTLWKMLSAPEKENPTAIVEHIRTRWQSARPDQAPALAAEIAQWQNALWKFNSIGQFGKQGGPKAWMEPVTPVAARQEIRTNFPESSDDKHFSLYLAVGNAGDGNTQDIVVWQQPRIEFKDRPPILLRDVRSLTRYVEAAAAAELARTSQYLGGVLALKTQPKPPNDVAQEKGLQPQLVEKWAALVDLERRTSPVLAGHFTEKITRGQGYEAINGWGSGATPNLLTNRSDQPISFLTLTVPARGVTVHPSPTSEARVAWQSPIDGRVRISGRVADADNKCGNGAAWRLELSSQAGAAVLASGIIDNGGNQDFQPKSVFEIKKGDVLSLVINARDQNHACDTTHVELKVADADDEKRVWDLASDVVDNILQGNPLPDSFGHAKVWHFCASGETPRPKLAVPPGSALARWREAVIGAKPPAEIDRLALAVQNVLTTKDDTSLGEPDKSLRQLLTGWSSPLDWAAIGKATPQATTPTNSERDSFGLDPDQFGTLPGSTTTDGSQVPLASSLHPADLCVRAPSVIEIRLPASLVAGAEFVTTGGLHSDAGKEGSVQLEVRTSKPATSDVLPSSPIVTHDGSEARRRVTAAFDAFRNLFPPALCYARIVPVDEVVTLTLYYREDQHLQRLMLDDQQIAHLNRLWDELYFVSREPLQLVTALEQLTEFATQDRPDLVSAFKPLEKPIKDRADAFRQRYLDAEPAQLNAALEFADRAWRRPLTDGERQLLQNLYRSLRDSEVPHEEAIRLTLARVLTSPNFLYRRETPAPGAKAAAVSNWELASRLSYFLWSSMPDAELGQLAAAGQLADEKTLVAQTRRMLNDDRTRRLAILFACQWLHVRNFDQDDGKNEKLYPEFALLRDDMYEESVRFFEDMFRTDGSILGLLDADHTFLNEALARHYGIDEVRGPEWRRVDGVRQKGRGGVLGMATVLASQSGASRTSPILRGNWVYETLLGERLPRPPANVPQLPEAVPEGLTARQLIEHHSSAPACAKCHVRIDPFGFALEQYDAIGRLRPQAQDTKTQLLDGTAIEGIEGLREYLLNVRRDDVVQQFCRKLLGYSLGRAVQLSDEPLLAAMRRSLEANDFRISVALEAIVTSPQFREIRGRDSLADE